MKSSPGRLGDKPLYVYNYMYILHIHIIYHNIIELNTLVGEQKEPNARNAVNLEKCNMALLEAKTCKKHLRKCHALV